MKPQETELNAISTPISEFVESVKVAASRDNTYQALWTRVLTDPTNTNHFSIRRDLLLYKHIVVVPEDAYLRRAIFEKTHATPMGGHSGHKGTISRIARSFY
ncbi:hypothetical protein ZOSMA_1G03530 [Zostera marina]|uniref:Integrase zinc-binding domain-containing protein n=1 Tax=Zostera marina TaxID=29655 RepID=A0A0K9PQ52_ZOSMR|nr:hypothetical protein ZOSMA_1G03530 [Zostera marina]